MSSHTIPEISVEELAGKLKSQDQFVLLDVREAWELALAKVTDDRLHVQPMSRFAHDGIKALPEQARSQEAEIYVLCHLGMRSANVTSWLSSQGWMHVYSVAGGIDEYARKIDSSVGTY